MTRRVPVQPSSASARCFFFQAEDGIRDKLVTGVQTCALPISDWGAELSASGAFAGVQIQLNSLVTRGQKGSRLDYGMLSLFDPHVGWGLEAGDVRSEERRVGKECRCRRSPDH